MRIFAFDPAQYRDMYAQTGWVHIKQGVDADFLEAVRDFARNSLTDERLGAFAIQGKKGQAVYDFPSEVNFPDEIFDVVSSLCGLSRETITLSERHIQSYDLDADPNPPAHKDRFPSQVSVGLSIEIPRESRLVLYPHEHREVNPFNSSTAFYRSLQPHELPEVVLKGAREIEIDDEAGDVVAFPGSTTWHLRRNSPGATNLYIKLNDFDCDPLGEDPETSARRDRTVALLAARGDSSLEQHSVVLSRRLDFVGRQYTRNNWQEQLQAALWGSDPFGLAPLQLEMLQKVDGKRTLGSLVDELCTDGRSRDAVLEDAITLVERGALDLID
jgi:hypothetical protein